MTPPDAMRSGWGWYSGGVGPYLTREEAISHAVLEGRFKWLPQGLIQINIVEARWEERNDEVLTIQAPDHAKKIQMC